MSAGRGGRVALIHGTAAAIAPAREAIAAVAPGLPLWHLLDDRLMADANDAGALTPELAQRMRALIDYALAGGADVVQLTCSLYGSVADGFSAAVPVRASDAAMLDGLARDRPARIGVLASLTASADESARRIAHVLGSHGGVGAELVPLVIPGALELVQRGAVAELATAAIAAVAGVQAPFDAIALAQYSLSPIAEALQEATGATVYSPVRLMAEELHDLMDGSSPAARP